MTRKKPRERGPFFFCTSSKVSHFFRDDDTYSLGFRKITKMNLWLLMFPLEKSMAGDVLRMFDLIFLRGRDPYPSLGKLGNSSELKSFELGMGYVIVLRRVNFNLKTSFKINKCLIFSGGLAECLVEALTGSMSALYCVQGFPFGSQDVYFERSVLMTRFPHKKQRFTLLFSNWGENTQCTYTRNLR